MNNNLVYLGLVCLAKLYIARQGCAVLRKAEQSMAEYCLAARYIATQRGIAVLLKMECHLLD